MRELADHLATPIFVVDTAGDLLFYNDPAERLLGSRFDETGMMPFAEWSTVFTPTDAHGAPIPPDELPLGDRGAAAAAGARRHVRSADSTVSAASSSVTAIPLQGQWGEHLGAAAIFWEAAMKVTVWGTRGSQAAPGPDTVRYGGNTSCVELQALPDTPRRARRRHRHPPSGRRAAGRCAPRRRVADASPHGPHPRPRVLRAAVPSPTSRCTSGVRARRPPTCAHA